MHRQWIESEDIVFGLMQNWSGWEVQKLRPDEGNSSGLMAGLTVDDRMEREILRLKLL